jgi:NAD(P)-dependent dehydrogenase (short-subunit alcohol dehydrogenase family)
MARFLVIGSNRGIGLEICKQLAERGDAVVAACRSSSPELDALGGVEVRSGVEITKRESLDALAKGLGAGTLDGLLVVSGILKRVSLDDFNPADIREQMEVNAIGPLVATVSLVGCLRSGSRVGLVTSRMGSIADNTSGGSYGYRMSKAALNMAGVSLAHDLKARGIAVRLLHPGWVRTEMTGGTGHIDAAEAARGLLARFDELDASTSGSFVHQNGEVLPW